MSEQLCCVAASKKWEDMGLKGFIHRDELLKSGQTLQEGRVSFSLREGVYYLSYRNWIWNMDFIEKHKEEQI